LSRNLRILLAAVPVLAVALLVVSWRLWPVDGFNGSFWILEGQAATVAALGFFIATALLASASPVHMPRGSVVSVAAAPIIAAGILGGPTAGAIVAVLGTIEVREVRGGVPWYGVLYNHSFPVFAGVLSGAAFLLVTDGAPIASNVGLVGGVVAGVVYVSVDTGMSSLAVALRESRPLEAVIRSDFRSFGMTLIGLTPMAWLMALAYIFVGPLVALVFALPLYTTRAAYKAVVDIRLMFTQTVKALASAIDARDPSTKKHSEHVSGIAVEIGQAMSLSETELERLEWAGLLHDIGKIGIRDSVLLKPEKLTREERILMNEHPAKGEEILKDVDQLSAERPLIRHHHEWYNGSGYPDRLIGDEIPLLSRVLHVADAFEAMTASRPYRPIPLSTAEAFQELERYAGIQFDPNVVEAFGLTRTAIEAQSQDDEPGEPEQQLVPVPTLGQVAAARAKAALPTTSAPAEP
jgi:HD-GYP domain-containing protein (c-di-GMP phosphodiesterase class II)